MIDNKDRGGRFGGRIKAEPGTCYADSRAPIPGGPQGWECPEISPLAACRQRQYTGVTR